MDERFVETDKRFKDKRGVVVRIISYDRQERRVIFMRPDYEHLCCVPKWYFEKYFIEVGKSD
ncbi:DUF4222 domain-containing protein [Pantoea ananatis]|uniref:DUF4222 domain-containing protein n=1 Tax=Pantoea ananas TaxID=553 RepID=UPI000D730ED1|nr:DUF4222 domain-containing protein [Pantoea ananatis]AWQ18453.1 DUF4222 domain-containing protein [Pantoea ananatis]RQN03380.1 DUF4222 domain-containing protein [Pantoea ananatis]